MRPQGYPSASIGTIHGTAALSQRTNSFTLTALVLELSTGSMRFRSAMSRRRRSRRTGENGSGMALVGLILGYLALAVWIAIGVVVVIAVNSL
ncbi:hypothetical protein [Nocardioides sp.]|uniref:hypothetical protein n=1 Tax=Nocardioides sp. TaxID=35761 RepID=UPI002D00DA10|nr:hypothetical protein [Nocardioides sp.]HSX65930.1 hypothetical protein [Nocardioides sp.]